MILKTQQKARHGNSTKISRAYPKVNRAYSQFRDSGILFAPANGKLYFELLTSFPAAQNHLPPCGGRFTPKSQIIQQDNH